MILLAQADLRIKVRHDYSYLLLLPRSLNDEGRAVPRCEYSGGGGGILVEDCTSCGNLKNDLGYAK